MAADRLIVPYGCASWRDGWIEVGRDGRARCTVPHVVIDRAANAPLRMQDGQYAIPLPARGSPDEELRQIEDDALARADPWSRPQAAFLRRYFAHVRRIVEDDAGALTERLGTLRDLFDHRAFVFAAPRALPRAFLAAEGGMIRCDCVFWTGGGALAVEVEGRTAPRSGRSGELARLAAAGVAVIRCPPDAEIASLGLPPLFERFTDGVSIPSGPFKARGIEAYAEPQISSSST
ncbi:MAG: hypothetical protein OXI22_10685 [Defluviicoccus sp.]|nr:hypothetical protein [Defluviicoccus sp.]MDE0384341.1 hypothetical protein [Defluviicoccus sp.]